MSQLQDDIDWSLTTWEGSRRAQPQRFLIDLQSGVPHAHFRAVVAEIRGARTRPLARRAPAPAFMVALGGACAAGRSVEARFVRNRLSERPLVQTPASAPDRLAALWACAAEDGRDALVNKSNRPARPRKSALPSGYAAVLAEVKRMIGDSRRRALATVNRELFWLYWEIGRVIAAQQEKAAWGEAVVEQLSADLRAEFPDMKGLSLPNMWKMRQVFLTYHRLDGWLAREKLSTVSRELSSPGLPESSACRLLLRLGGAQSRVERTRASCAGPFAVGSDGKRTLSLRP